MTDREFKPGVYLLNSKESAPIVWFDGDYFWLPGWECRLEPSNKDDDLSINVDNIGELIWEPDSPITKSESIANSVNQIKFLLSHLEGLLQIEAGQGHTLTDSEATNG